MRGDRGGDADRAVGDLQELRHDEGGGAHHRRHQLAAGGADRLDRRRACSARSPSLIMVGMVTMPTASTFDDRAAGDHAEQRRADHRDLGGAAAEAAHRRHREIGEEVGAAGARQHLAQDRERDDDQHRHPQDRADHAVDVEAEVDDQPLGRDRAGLEIARQVRADVDVDRHRQDDGDEAPAGGAAARLPAPGTIRIALPMMPSSGSIASLVGQRLVAHGDVAAEHERDDRGADPVEPARRRRLGLPISVQAER